MRMGINYKSEF